VVEHGTRTIIIPSKAAWIRGPIDEDGFADKIICKCNLLSEIFTAVYLKRLAVWDVTLCRIVVIHVQKACSTFETSVTIDGWLDEWKHGMDIWMDRE
jgi:hypothetical protein